MKVILTKEVLGLGDPGEVVEVKNGYGRNFLVPQGMAMMATKRNMAAVEAERKRIQAVHAKQAEELKGEAAKLSGIHLKVVTKAGEGGKLYGSVTNQDLAKALAGLGHEVDRRRIIIAQPIRRLGEHTAQIKLHTDVIVDLKVTVESDAPEVAAAAAPAAVAAEVETPAEESPQEETQA